MSSMLDLGSSLSEASLPWILLGLLISQLGFPLPETPFIVAAGVVAQRSGLGMLVPIAACCVAVLIGDLSLFYSARCIGLGAFSRRPLRWLIPMSAQPPMHRLFERHGAMAIFVARFITGVRLAAFAFAGMRRMPVVRFVAWDGLAILLTVPLFAGLGFLFATTADALTQRVATANRVIAAALVLTVLGYVGVVLVRRRN